LSIHVKVTSNIAFVVLYERQSHSCFHLSESLVFAYFISAIHVCICIYLSILFYCFSSL